MSSHRQQAPACGSSRLPGAIWAGDLGGVASTVRMQKGIHDVPFCVWLDGGHSAAQDRSAAANAKRPARRPSLHTGQRNASHDSLADLVDSFQASGRYVLTREEALDALHVSEEALKKAVRRLGAKRRLAVPHRGFYVIVPVEYRDAGAPPPSWFIDDLMKFERQRYYVGLLSAAALHGAAHQQPQEFQVVTGEQLRPSRAGRARIRFLKKRDIEETPTVSVKTETGSMKVSTPEATAFDLLRYLEASGHLGNVATVLAELAERLDPERLVEVAKREGDLSNVQRLGYMLEHVGAGDAASSLAPWTAQQRPRFVPLRPGGDSRTAPKDARWRVVVNESVEAET